MTHVSNVLEGSMGGNVHNDLIRIHKYLSEILAITTKIDEIHRAKALVDAALMLDAINYDLAVAIHKAVEQAQKKAYALFVFAAKPRTQENKLTHKTNNSLRISERILGEMPISFSLPDAPPHTEDHEQPKDSLVLSTFEAMSNQGIVNRKPSQCPDCGCDYIQTANFGAIEKDANSWYCPVCGLWLGDFKRWN